MSEEKKPHFLSGMTHAVVHVSEKTEVKATGIIATIDLCFSNDDNAITGLCYIRDEEGNTTWRVPHYEVDEDNIPIYVPVFRGELLKKLCAVGARVIDRIRTDIGKPEFGKNYRVGETAEVITSEE